jgi:large conductance mechanosensitive channel
MLRGLKGFNSQGDLLIAAGGLLMALAGYFLVQAIVGGLIAPLISVVIGDPIFALNSFTIDGSEFRYGAVIEAAITFVLAVGLVYLLVVLYRRLQGEGGAANTRACPECTSSISAAAKRCPHCTAVLPVSGG